MDVILLIALAWLFLLVLALAILRTAGLADRAAERRLREAARAPSRRRRRRRASRRPDGRRVPLAGAAGRRRRRRRARARAARTPARRPARAGADATLCLINAARRARGLAPLGADARLARAARRHAADMVARGFFSHDAPGGVSFVDRLRRVGYPGGCAWSGGETLAWGAGAKATPASRVSAWMRSPPAPPILLSPGFREAGIGIAAGVARRLRARLHVRRRVRAPTLLSARS